MGEIPDFTESELWLINSTLEERYGAPCEIQLAESELRLDRGKTELTPCPTVYWEAGDCHFVIAKTGDRRYRCQFFYRIHQMYGTGVEEYDDLTECVVTLLQVQADHQLSEHTDGA
ncbi:MAG TPA: hypothetical protein ENK05_09185 [Gammaproteobacteria bacterium]|nr:hypothetical protein [Gammaproteobacteria bacterium]